MNHYVSDTSSSLNTEQRSGMLFDLANDVTKNAMDRFISKYSSTVITYSDLDIHVVQMDTLMSNKHNFNFPHKKGVKIQNNVRNHRSFSINYQNKKIQNSVLDK